MIIFTFIYNCLQLLNLDLNAITQLLKRTNECCLNQWFFSFLREPEPERTAHDVTIGPIPYRFTLHCCNIPQLISFADRS